MQGTRPKVTLGAVTFASGNLLELETTVEYSS